MAKLIGMGGNITVSAATYPVSTWSAAISNDVQDVTDTASAGWIARIAGVSSGEFTFTAFWGSAVATLSTTFAIGTSVTGTFHIGGGAQTFVVTGYISSFTVTNPAKSPVEFQCTLQSTGSVTMPT